VLRLSLFIIFRLIWGVFQSILAAPKMVLESCLFALLWLCVLFTPTVATPPVSAAVSAPFHDVSDHLAAASVSHNVESPLAPTLQGFRFRSRRLRYDPIVRHSTCPQGCIAAPRGPGAQKDDSHANSLIYNTDGKHNSLGKLQARQSDSGSDGSHFHSHDQMEHEADDGKQGPNAHPSSPKCPHGCLEAPEFF
jgi:hypothetical protein